MLINREIDNGNMVVLLTFILSSMSFRLLFLGQNHTQVTIGRDRFEDIFTLLIQFRPDTLLVNSLVSFPDTPGVIKLIREIHKETGSELIISIHDYLAICPSHHLLNSGGQFCYIPEMEVCHNCLKNNDTGFVSMAGSRSPEPWRKSWMDFFATAGEVRCFSQSSEKLMLTVFPEIENKIVIQPHQVKKLQRVNFKPVDIENIRVAVIGAINFHKGAKILSELVRAILDTKSSVRIIIIGTTEIQYEEKIVSVTGSYIPEDLPKIILKNKVSLVLMPSVCPETFSFVTHEVVAMGLPLLTFDLGAQAEIAGKYPLGRVVKLSDGMQLLSDIQEFALYLQSENHALS